MGPVSGMTHTSISSVDFTPPAVANSARGAAVLVGAPEIFALT